MASGDGRRVLKGPPRRHQQLILSYQVDPSVRRLSRHVQPNRRGPRRILRTRKRQNRHIKNITFRYGYWL